MDDVWKASKPFLPQVALVMVCCHSNRKQTKITSQHILSLHHMLGTVWGVMGRKEGLRNLSKITKTKYNKVRSPRSQNEWPFKLTCNIWKLGRWCRKPRKNTWCASYRIRPPCWLSWCLPLVPMPGTDLPCMYQVWWIWAELSKAKGMSLCLICGAVSSSTMTLLFSYRFKQSLVKLVFSDKH